jgi:hypothetical protein
METHFVSRVNRSELGGCGAAGCLVVTAVFWELAEDAEAPESPTLTSLWSHLPLHQGVSILWWDPSQQQQVVAFHGLLTCSNSWSPIID